MQTQSRDVQSGLSSKLFSVFRSTSTEVRLPRVTSLDMARPLSIPPGDSVSFYDILEVSVGRNLVHLKICENGFSTDRSDSHGKRILTQYHLSKIEWFVVDDSINEILFQYHDFSTDDQFQVAFRTPQYRLVWDTMCHYLHRKGEKLKQKQQQQQSLRAQSADIYTPQPPSPGTSPTLGYLPQPQPLSALGAEEQPQPLLALGDFQPRIVSPRDKITTSGSCSTNKALAIQLSKPASTSPSLPDSSSACIVLPPPPRRRKSPGSAIAGIGPGQSSGLRRAVTSVGPAATASSDIYDIRSRHNAYTATNNNGNASIVSPSSMHSGTVPLVSLLDSDFSPEWSTNTAKQLHQSPVPGSGIGGFDDFVPALSSTSTSAFVSPATSCELSCTTSPAFASPMMGVAFVPSPVVMPGTAAPALFGSGLMRRPDGMHAMTIPRGAAVEALQWNAFAAPAPTAASASVNLINW